MNYTLASVLLLSLLSCGKNDAIISVDASMAPYFEMFENNIGVSTKDISGHFVLLTSPEVGQCEKIDGNKDVQIDINYWNRATDDQRETLIFHELGHCAMNLKHEGALGSSGCPISLMFPLTINPLCFDLFRIKYYEELESRK